jgi:4-diphosphocytidyl-2C-methyl-D-erythritol kinase
VSSPIADELLAAGAVRADVTGAGPTVYGLFTDSTSAEQALDAVDGRGWTALARPVDG